jgi:nicotinic acid mononucleotide adenylyltransferase
MKFGEQVVNGYHVYAALAGGAAGLPAQLLYTPNTSSFLVGCNFLYGTDTTDEFLGFQPSSYCSREEVLQLAMEAFVRAKIHGFTNPSANTPMGVATTCVLASITSPPRRGDHRIWAAAVTEKGAWVRNVTLAKGMGVDFRKYDDNRAKAEVMAVMCGDGEVVSEEELRTVFFKHPYFRFNGTRSRLKEIDLLYCGAFNPLHDGHRVIMDAVHSLSLRNGKHSTYSICADHPHKPGLKVTDMLSRAAEFRMERWTSRSPVNLLFTEKDPLFIQKFQAFQDCTFVMGVDTFTRMVDPKWGVDATAIWKAAEDSRVTVCVVDRIRDGVITRADEAIQAFVPQNHRGRWKVLEGVHVVDISSTQLREAANTAT